MLFAKDVTLNQRKGVAELPNDPCVVSPQVLSTPLTFPVKALATSAFGICAIAATIVVVCQQQDLWSLVFGPILLFVGYAMLRPTFQMKRVLMDADGIHVRGFFSRFSVPFERIVSGDYRIHRNCATVVLNIADEMGGTTEVVFMPAMGIAPQKNLVLCNFQRAAGVTLTRVGGFNLNWLKRLWKR